MEHWEPYQLLVLGQAVHGNEGQVEEAAHVELCKVALLLVVQAAHVVHDGAHARVHLQRVLVLQAVYRHTGGAKVQNQEGTGP